MVLLIFAFLFRSPKCKTLELKSLLTRKLEKRKADKIKFEGQVESANGLQATWVIFAFANLTRRVIIQMPIATFGRDLKKLVAVGNFYSVADKDILKVP